MLQLSSNAFSGFEFEQRVSSAIVRCLEEQKIPEISALRELVLGHPELLALLTNRIAEHLHSHPEDMHTWIEYISTMTEREGHIFLDAYPLSLEASSALDDCYRAIPVILIAPTGLGAEVLLGTLEGDIDEALDNWRHVLDLIPELHAALSQICSRMGLVAYMAMDGLIRKYFHQGDETEFARRFKDQITACSLLSSLSQHVFGINVDTDLVEVAVNDIEGLAEVIKAYHWLNREGMLFEIDFLLHMHPAFKSALSPLKSLITNS